MLFYTLGCELNQAVDAALLAELYAQVKSLTGDALVRDNSGSGEAYGGWLAESADFYDNHFYCDLQFLHPLLNTFAPAWRAEKPWLMGEFCDYDTVRDVPAILKAGSGALPWWLHPDAQTNPQGARWEYRSIQHADKLSESGLLKRSQSPSPALGKEVWHRDIRELVEASHRQGLLHRKVTLEAVRARRDLSGYVVTGEADTPISTPGMWDDLGRIQIRARCLSRLQRRPGPVGRLGSTASVGCWRRPTGLLGPLQLSGWGDGAGSPDRFELCWLSRPSPVGLEGRLLGQNAVRQRRGCRRADPWPRAGAGRGRVSSPTGHPTPAG